MKGVRGLIVIAVLLAALFTGAAPASTVTPVQRAALRAIAKAHLDAPTASALRAEVNRAAHLARTLPSGRREHVAVALGELAASEGWLTKPRALIFLGELKANDTYFAQHWAPAPKTDITDADGLVYRYFAGRCFEFHPLGNFSALNALVAAGNAAGAQRLADALVARAVYLRRGGIGWEYEFPYGGPAPWISGMAQAVAAQALARTAALVPAESSMLLAKARAAYQAIPAGLLTSVAAGPWIRLYSFSSTPVLNAQLQTVLSLRTYAADANDQQAAALATRLQNAAASMLPRFDTGYWTYYALPNDPSPLDYQQYVVQLLQRLARSDARFADAATRFAAYQQQPPAFQLANGGLGTLTFWLSKPAQVTVDTAAGPSRSVALDGGWHTLGWGEPKRAGVYPVRVAAVDWAGNRTSFQMLPFVRAAATTARTTAAAGAPAAPAFAVGAALADPSQSAAAATLGLHLVRIGVAWPPGATAPDPGVVQALQGVAPGVQTVIELIASPLPADDTGRSALAQYAASLAAQVPSLHSLVLEPAATTSTATAYAAAFAAIRAALPTTKLGLALDGASDPADTYAQTLAALAGVTPDEVLLHPAPAPATGAWAIGDLAQAAATVQAPLFADGIAAPYPAAISTAACTAGVAGVLLDDLSELSATGVQSAATSAQRGAIVCPGLKAQVSASTLTFPTTLTSPVSLSLACDRDCLYLATLDRGGRPVVARRGSLAGGAAAATVTLPAAKLTAGASYTVTVRLVARVNPGAVTTLASPPLVAG